MNKPLISVIVPIYNVEKYLERAVSSLTTQTYDNLEIILVDDGSPDSCPALCDELAKLDNRIKVVHKENGGLSSARNAGINIAKGEYLSFIDGDDYVSSDMYELLYRAISENNADIAICGINWVNEDGTKYENVCPSPIIDEVFDKATAFRKLVPANSFYYVTACNKLYKKELFSNVLFPEGKINEDEYTVHHFFNNSNKIVSIKEELYFYVQRENSIMHKPFSVKKLDGVWAYLDRYKLYRKLGYKKEAKAVAMKACNLLILYIKKGNVIKRFRAFNKLFRKVSFLVFRNAKIIKLFPIYLLKLIKDLFSRK